MQSKEPDLVMYSYNPSTGEDAVAGSNVRGQLGTSSQHINKYVDETLKAIMRTKTFDSLLTIVRNQF